MSPKIQKRWQWALGIFGIMVIIMILIFVQGTGSISNFYFIPAGTFSPFHEMETPTQLHTVSTAIAIAVKADEISTGNEYLPDESSLEIYDPGTDTTYRLYPEQEEYDSLKNNITAVLRSIKFQMKCSLPYDEYRHMKMDYRYVTFRSADNISARYCYNNISIRCTDIPADEFTILLQEKNPNGTGTGCGESDSIFAYRKGSDAGIWRLGEGDKYLLENLDRNVQDFATIKFRGA